MCIRDRSVHDNITIVDILIEGVVELYDVEVMSIVEPIIRTSPCSLCSTTTIVTPWGLITEFIRYPEG